METFNVGDRIMDVLLGDVEQGTIIRVGKCRDMLVDADKKYNIINSQLGGIDCIAVEYDKCPGRLYIFPKSYPTVTKIKIV